MSGKALALRASLGKVAAVLFRRRAAPPGLTGVDDSRGWWPINLGRAPGDWQADVDVKLDSVLAQDAVFGCTTLIASDIAKLGVDLVARVNGVWEAANSPAFSPVLRKPNRYQTWQQFVESWIISKLTHGNTYILKERDARGVVIRLYVLDPCRVHVMVAPDGSVYYGLKEDNLSGLAEEEVAAPASEIIHDRFNCLFHPLVGLSPIFASGLAATQALQIQKSSAKFFQNQSRPGGMLSAPAAISDETSKRLKETFERNFAGPNIGRLFVAGDGLTYTPMIVNAVDAQLVEQLKISATQVCATLHVPAHMVGAAPEPTYSTTEATQRYYNQCLHALIRSLELCLTEGLGLPAAGAVGREMRVRVNLDDLIRLDPKTLTEVEGLKVQRSIAAPNEARAKFDLPPVEGGDSPMAQHQDYSLAALAKRDALPNPFAPTAGTNAAYASEEEMKEPEVRALVREMLLSMPQPTAARDGRDGQAGPPGDPGRDADPEQVAQVVRASVADLLPDALERAVTKATPLIAHKAALLVPPPRDGADGAEGVAGRDGLSVEDLDIKLKDGRTLEITLQAGGRRAASKTVTLDGLPVYRGVYKSGTRYLKGDTITYGGSTWIAKLDTSDAPKSAAGDVWTMCVKGTR